MPDTPMIEEKPIAFYNHRECPPCKRESNWTYSDASLRRESVPSRFQQDFTEIATLGKGHFGKVLRSQNKLDQLHYAVKVSTKKIKSNLK